MARSPCGGHCYCRDGVSFSMKSPVGALFRPRTLGGLFFDRLQRRRLFFGRFVGSAPFHKLVLRCVFCPVAYALLLFSVFCIAASVLLRCTAFLLMYCYVLRCLPASGPNSDCP